MTPRLSLVIPAYNEEARIAATLRSVDAYLSHQDYTSEVIVVDDGSRDGTRAVVDKTATECATRVQLLQLPANLGKGAAVREGLRQARGDIRVFYDADASTPIEELEKLFPQFEAGADVVIGSRALPDSRVELHQAWYRERMGRTFNALLRMLRLTHFHDTQCGFKGFTRAACEILLPRQRIRHFSFDAELLHIAQMHQLRVDEIPVRWMNSPQSRVNPVIDSAKMFMDLLRIRANHWRGRYD